MLLPAKLPQCPVSQLEISSSGMEDSVAQSRRNTTFMVVHIYNPSTQEVEIGEL
jgi:hypothetical protein